MRSQRARAGTVCLSGFLVKCAVAVAWLVSIAAPISPVLADVDAVDRGAYLATAADCVACHTIPRGQPFAGGEAIETPFGKIYPPNITPDNVTGIGAWSDADFIRALWHGIGKGGEHLYPAFPYTDFTRLSERDVLDIRAYLATVPAVHRATPPNQLIFPFSIRGLMWFWDLLFLDDRRFAIDPLKSTKWNRGAYLVTGMAHCGECHTPRNLLQGKRDDRAFAGAVASGWYAPNISSSATDGIGSWSDEEIKDFLRTGSNLRHGIAGGPMAAAVLDSFSHFSDSDLASIVAYLRSLQPQDNSQRWPDRELAKPSPYARPGTSSVGGTLYEGLCARCHGADGMGIADNPAIALDRTVTGLDAGNVIQIVLNGADPTKQTGVKRMPAFGRRLTDRQIAEIVNALLDKFQSRAPYITDETVRDIRQSH